MGHLEEHLLPRVHAHLKEACELADELAAAIGLPTTAQEEHAAREAEHSAAMAEQMAPVEEPAEDPKPKSKK